VGGQGDRAVYDYAAHQEPEEESVLPLPLLTARMPAVLTADLLMAAERLAAARGADQLTVDHGAAPRPPQAFSVDTGMFPMPRTAGVGGQGRGDGGIEADRSFTSNGEVRFGPEVTFGLAQERPREGERLHSGGGGGRQSSLWSESSAGLQAFTSTATAATADVARREGSSPLLPAHVMRVIRTRTPHYPPPQDFFGQTSRSSASAGSIRGRGGGGEGSSFGKPPLGESIRTSSSRGALQGGRRTPAPTMSTARDTSSACAFPPPRPATAASYSSGAGGSAAGTGQYSYDGGSFGRGSSSRSGRLRAAHAHALPAAAAVGPPLTVLPTREKLIAAGCDPSGWVRPPPDTADTKADPDAPRLTPAGSTGADPHEKWRKSLPLRVVVGGAARYPLRFGAEHGVGRPRALVFEHIPGSRVLAGAMPVYRLPNGREAYYYDQGSPLYEETHLDVLTPPGQPRTLSDLCNDQLPVRGILDRLSIPSDEGAGEGFAPPPPTCPLPAGLGQLSAHSGAPVDSKSEPNSPWCQHPNQSVILHTQ